MTKKRPRFSDVWVGMSRKLLPFADAASDDLPLGRLLRLSLFQVCAGMALTLLTGTLNRVMIVELGVPAWLVALMISIPLLAAPFRALIGHKSDTHRSHFGWRRGPYIWFGSLFMFGGLAIMPFALLLLSGGAVGPWWAGHVAAAIAFLFVGAGLHTTQTAGLALATDLAPEKDRPRVVALLYLMLLVGMGVSALVYGWLLTDFTQTKLIQVIQGSAVLAIVFNLVALWKQEAKDARVADMTAPRPSFSESWRSLMDDPRAKRLLICVGLGTMAFGMQDILLEPFGAEILSMTVSQTTRLTAIFAGGTLLGFAIAARQLSRDSDPARISAFGLLIGVVAFSLVIFSEPLGSSFLFQAGTFLIGLGGGLFSVCMLTASMSLAKSADSGIALGAWGAVQATAAGSALFLGGAIKDSVQTGFAMSAVGEAHPAIGYSAVYHIEIFLLFLALAVLGPIVRRSPQLGASPSQQSRKFGLAAFPE